MLKKVLLIIACFVIAIPSLIYAASGSGETVVIPNIDDSNLDEYGNEKGYKYYDYVEDMPKVIEYTAEEKNNNPDKHVSINYKKPNISSAVYNLGQNNGTIRCDGVTYVLSNRGEFGDYETVTINNVLYRLDDGLITASHTGQYLYNGVYYDVDYQGNMYAPKHKWVEKQLYNKVYGEWEETNECLFKYEIPFNTLWKNRPLSAEELEDLHSGPGVNLEPMEKYGLDGNLQIVGANRKIEVTDKESTATKAPVAVKDPMNPMKAKSTKKKKD